MVAQSTLSTLRTNPTTANLERIENWLDALASAADAAAQGEELTRYLRTVSRFWRYSARNCWLIALQRPDATRVASRKTWESMGRRILRDEWRRALQILCPHFKKVQDPTTGEEHEILTHFSTGYVYDVSQTEGEPLARLAWQDAAGDYTALYTMLLTTARRAGLAVEVTDDLGEEVHGVSTGRGVILLNGRDTPGQLCQTILHEWAHERCHGPRERQTFTHQMLECQAEAIAYCCCQALEIPSPNTPTYLAFYRVDRVLLVQNMEAIRLGVARIMREIEHVGEIAAAPAA